MLATAPPVFAYYTDNRPSLASTLIAEGTVFTAGANSTDGTAVTLLSALGHDVHLVRLRLSGIGTAAADSNAVGDLLIDPAGGTSWTPLINDLVCGFTILVASGTTTGSAYEFPIYIPAGATVGWQAKTAHTSDITAGLAFIEVFGEPARPEMYWCGSGVETLGVSDAKGTSITPGASNGFGSWTSVGSTTTRHYKSAQLGINGSDATALGKSYKFEIGHGSARLPGSNASTLTINTSENAGRQAFGATYCSIPVGTQMQARAMCDTTSPENIFVGIYGVY